MSEGIREIKIGLQVKSSPAISIVIPNYNTASYISETLDSVFAQTFKDFEVIVINDAAPDTDKLKEVLKIYWDRIVFIDKEKNEGTSATRNLAVSHARAEVISFLDADDIWSPTYLEELHAFLNENDFDMAYTDAETFLNGSPKKHHDFLPYNPAQGQITRKLLIEGKCHILPSGTLIKKKAFLAVGGFDPKVARTEDFDLWMRLLFNGTRIGYLRKILFKFRISPGSGSGDSIVRLERTRDIWRVLQAKLPFTDEENRTIERHVEEADAAVLRAKGRMFINQRNWPAAREAFSLAAKKADELGLPLKHRLKMRTIMLLLNLSPGLLLKLFRSFRSEELDYMPADRNIV